MLEGEAIQSGAEPRCPDCRTMPCIDVYMSNAGYYVGTWCQCGPYSRESEYYRTREDANRDLQSGMYGRVG